MIFSQEGVVSTIPDVLRRPERGEAPRYPRDMVIGELGQGQAPREAYHFAQNLLGALIRGNEAAPDLAALTEELLEEISGLEPRTYRLGGGRIEADGTVSFLVRFVGRMESITGELFVRETESESWLLDDLILEERRALTEIRDSYRFDFSPYERFF